MKEPNLKKTLISGIISLILCASMLIGTTFSWFTDSVSTPDNIIATGTLDIELEYLDNKGDWKIVDENTNIFGNTLWEPGHTSVVYFKISNNGSLALEYKFDIGIINEYTGFDANGQKIYLSDYLVSKMVEMDDELKIFNNRQDAITAEGTLVDIRKHNNSEGFLAPGDSNYIALIITMPASVGNKTNYHGVEIPRIEFGVNLYAIQHEYENDGFDPNYDKDAEYTRLYGILIKDEASFDVSDYDFDLLSTKRVDSLIHITDGAETNIYGNTTRVIRSNGISNAPVISADENSVINIYGGSYCANKVPIISLTDGAKLNIYRGIFSAEQFTDSAEQTDRLLYCEKASDCEINIYGGTFVNYDPRDTHLGNLVADGLIVHTSVRDNGDIWYTVTTEEFKDYTPVYSVDDVTNAFNKGITDIYFACDLNPTPDVEHLMYGKTTDPLIVNGQGAIITLDGTGTAPGFNDYSYFAIIPIKGCDAEVSNFTYTGEGFVEIGHHGQGGGTYVANNLVLDNLISTLFIPNGSAFISPGFSHYGTLTLNNCVMKGTTTKKTGYTPYDAAFVNGTNTFIEGGEYGSIYISDQGKATIRNAVIDNIDSYAIIYRGKPLGLLTIGAGAKVGTINLKAPSYPPSIVIEEGAEVGEIIYKGVSYTVEEWQNRPA
jgi:predicted ribosomally synthesized peptide with SipW-like signal peptide